MFSNFSDTSKVSYLVKEIERELVCDTENEAIIRRIAQITEFMAGRSTTVELEDNEKDQLLGDDKLLKELNTEFCKTEVGKKFLELLIKELRDRFLVLAKHSKHMGWKFLCYYRLVEVMKILGIELEEDFSPHIRLCYSISISFPEKMSREERKKELEIWDECVFNSGIIDFSRKKPLTRKAYME